MQTLNVFLMDSMHFELIFLLDLAGLFFLSRMCLDEVPAGVAVFNDFDEVHTDSFAPSSRHQQKNTSLRMRWLGFFPL